MAQPSVLPLLFNSVSLAIDLDTCPCLMKAKFILCDLQRMSGRAQFASVHEMKLDYFGENFNAT